MLWIQNCPAPERRVLLQMKRALGYSFVIFFLFGSLALCEVFSVGGESGFQEISVNTGEQFRVNLEGKGWYLNRYDTERLSFKYRIIGQSVTSFIIIPKKAGTAYLLFSYMMDDLYVKVTINGVGDSKGQPLEPAGEPVVEAKEPKQPEETALLEQEEQPPSPPKEQTAEKMEEGEIYYTDKDERVVAVPLKDEDDNYRRGVRLRKKGLNEQAIVSFFGYLDDCEECRYRVDASIQLAESLIAVGRGQESGRYLDTVIESGSTKYLKSALLMRGDLYYREGKLEEALDAYSRCMELGEDTPRLIRRVADIHYGLNDYKGALDLYERLEQLNRLDDVVLFRVATIYDSPGEPRDVERAYRYYKLLIDKYNDSRYRPFAERRVSFLEENFFNYR
jgi:tetratricopeptide (TPR) repeat protein